MQDDFCDVAVIGLGPIGASEIAYLSSVGHRCIGVEVSDLAIRNAKDVNFLKDRTDLDVDTIENVSASIQVVKSISDLPEKVKTCIVCVPTEYDGRPDMTTLSQVIIEVVKHFTSRLLDLNLLIESTVIPGYFSSFVVPLLESEFVDGKKLDFKYAYSPRRDWFLSSERANRGVYRVLSANRADTLSFFNSLLEPAWPNLVLTDDILATEVAKLFENAVRYIGISFAHEIARSFPDVNIDHVFELAGSKWNIERYFNSLGVGGYCTPTSVRYLMQSHLCKQSMEFAGLADRIGKFQIDDCVAFLIRRCVRAVGIIGLRYRPPFRSAVESAAVRLAKALSENAIEVFAFDGVIFGRDVRHEYIQNLTEDRTTIDAVVLHVVATEDELRLAHALTTNTDRIIIDNREEQSQPIYSGPFYYSTRHIQFGPLK